MAGGVLMTWGDLRFEVAWEAYQLMERTTAYQWAANARFGTHAQRQFTGPGDDTITVSGTLFPKFRGKPQHIQNIRDAAAEGKPRILTTGTGQALGKWVILKVTEGHSNLLDNGLPQKLTFSVTFEYYGAGSEQ